jgi:hypothetical protein
MIKDAFGARNAEAQTNSQSAYGHDQAKGDGDPRVALARENDDAALLHQRYLGRDG